MSLLKIGNEYFNPKHIVHIIDGEITITFNVSDGDRAFLTRIQEQELVTDFRNWLSDNSK